jgi:hypothetical protein
MKAPMAMMKGKEQRPKERKPLLPVKRVIWNAAKERRLCKK